MIYFSREQKPFLIAIAGLFILFVASEVYSNTRISSLSNKIALLSSDISSLSADVASTTLDLRTSIDETNTSLSDALSDQKQNVGVIQKKLGRFEDDVDDLSGTLTTLQKLAGTDPELLKKYSKVYFLNENYVPEHLSEIPKAYQYSDTKQLLIHSDVLPHLLDMIDAASSTKIALYVSSGYRSFAEQRALKNNYSIIYGAGTANSFSADQGYSEHQLGTTVDMITSGVGGVLENFEQTPAYVWMTKNAHKYGFILSYPKSNGYYIYEPWHWRFVGIDLATYMYKKGKNFYDLDQRTIDAYLVNIFD